MWGWNGLAVGGNPEVGCGDGVAGLPSEVYDNNTLYTSATICVSEEDSLVLIHRDSMAMGAVTSRLRLAATRPLGLTAQAAGTIGPFSLCLPWRICLVLPSPSSQTP